MINVRDCREEKIRFTLCKTWEKIMTLVWRRGIRATHKKILYFSKEYSEEDAFLPRKCKGDKFPRFTARKKSGLHWPLCETEEKIMTLV